MPVAVFYVILFTKQRAMEVKDYDYFTAQINCPAEYGCCDRGEGMYECYLRSNWKETYLVNTCTQTVYKVVDADGNIVAFTTADVDFNSVDKMEHTANAHHMLARYGFNINPFENGVALVSWTLYPDGQYFADEDGYGMEDNDEVRVYAYIDTHCRVLIPFQDMEDAAYREQCRERAVEMTGKNFLANEK